MKGSFDGGRADSVRDVPARRARPLRWSACVLGAACVWACAQSGQRATDPERIRANARANASKARHKPGRALGLDASLLATVRQGTFGPFIARREAEALLVWASASGDSSAWHAQPLSERGARGQLQRGGAVAKDVGLVAVAPGGAEESGYYLVASSHGVQGERVEALAFASDGKLRGGPVVLASPAFTASSVLWVHVVGTARGALAFWAVGHGAAADIYSVVLGRDAAPQGQPQKLRSGALAWQIAPAPEGAALATVEGEPGAAAGRVQFELLDAEANRSPAIALTDGATAQNDLDMVRAGAGWLLAWTDARGLEPDVYLIRLDGAGKAASPAHAALAPFGERALIRLVAPHAGSDVAYLAWEEVGTQHVAARTADASSVRRIQLAAVRADGGVDADRGYVEHAASDGSIPELVAGPRGLHALLLAPDCVEGACSDDGVPSYVGLGSGFEPFASQPIRLRAAGGEFAAMAWGLGCSTQGCGALAALPQDPAPVYQVSLGPQVGLGRVWGGAVQRGDKPWTRTMRAIARPESVADLDAVAQHDGSSLLAWVSYFDPSTPYAPRTTPAPDGRYAPTRARLEVVRRESGSDPVAEPLTVSYRARSLGGVSLTSTDRDGRALLLWSALDNEVPQVFATLLDTRGRRLSQRMLTRTPGEVIDVAAALVDDGFVVTWVDARNGHPEAFARKLDGNLRDRGPDVQLSHGVGSATDLSAVHRGEEVWTVRTDARGERVGVARVFMTRLSARDASLVGSERALSSAHVHAHSPSVAAWRDGAVLAWVEGAGVSTSGKSAVKLQVVDARGEPSGEALGLAGGNGILVSVALQCLDESCHLVVGERTASGLEWRGGSWRPGERPKLRALVGGSGLLRDTIPPVLVGDRMWYADRLGRDGAVRELTLEW